MRYTWLVEKYLEGELSGEALRKFELDILRKPEVAEELEKIRTTERFIREQHKKMQISSGLIEDFEDLENVMHEADISRELEDLKIRKISSSDKDYLDFRTKVFESQVRNNLGKHKSQKVLVRKVSIWMTAVCVAALIFTSTFLFINHNNSGNIDLYKQFFTPRYADVERSYGQEGDDQFNEALRAYNNADFEHAFQMMNNIPEQGVGNKFYLYKGITAMELGKFQVAIELFNNLNQDENLKHEALWLKSLCYLGMDNEPAARMILEEIIDTNGYYKKKARALLRKM